jgi:hypothetical protein
MVVRIVLAILPALRGRAVAVWRFGVLGGAKLRTSWPDERIAPDRTGSAKGMEHEFTIPARVVEVTEAPQEVDPDNRELLPPAPAATDDGTPISAPAKPDDEPSR